MRRPRKRLFSEILFDFPSYTEKFLRIKTKAAQLVPLKFNRAQKELWKVVQKQISNGQPVRVVCLKGRQLGSTTFWVAYEFWKAVTNKNTHVLIVAHNLESTTNIFSIAQLMYECLPDEVRPMRQRSNKKELLLQNPDSNARLQNPGLRSLIEVRTAGSEESGRGSFYHHLHLSEVAYYKDPEAVFTSFLPTVPHLEGTTIVLESTAYGAGSWFHDFWLRSKEGETGFEPVFLPWFFEPTYRLSDAETKVWMDAAPLDDLELDLKKRFGLSDNQIAFRRMLLAQRGEVYVHQEFPSTEDECWIGSGIPVFDRDRIREMLQDAMQNMPKFVGEVDTAHASLVPNDNGRLRVWEFPEQGYSYVVGVDSSYGVEGGSDTAIVVLKRGPQQVHVATWVGSVTPLDAVPIVEFLGRMYFNAMISVEVNGPGISIQEALSRYYPYLYRWRTLDNAWQNLTQKGGWETSIKSKPILINHMNYQLAHKNFVTYDIELLHQMFGFIYVDNMRAIAEAGPGYKDDIVMAVMIASITDYLDGGYSLYSGVNFNKYLTQSSTKEDNRFDPYKHDLDMDRILYGGSGVF